jgi:hypothetical protein
MSRVFAFFKHVISTATLACAVAPASSGATDFQAIYLQGIVIATHWQGDSITVTVNATGAAPPAALTRFAIPKHKPTADTDPVIVLGTAKAPSANEKTWSIELASRATLEAWHIAPMNIGETIAVVGYAKSKVNDAKRSTILAEYLIGNGKVTPLRALPR